MAQLIVEIIDDKGGVRSRQRLYALPATIGRAYTNDVILDDPHACGHHLSIVVSDDGSLLAVDANSVNGTRERVATGKRWAISPPTQTIDLRPETELLVGATRIRVHREDESVTPAIPLHLPTSAARWTRLERTIAQFASPRLFVALALTFVVAVSILNYWSNYDRLASRKVIGLVLLATALAMFWAGAWALASRLKTGSSRFRAHASITCALVLVCIVMTLGDGLLRFALPESSFGVVFNGLAVVLDHASAFVVFTAFLGAHLAYSSSMSVRRRWVTAGASVGVIMALGTIVEQSAKDDFSTKLEFPETLLPIDTRFMRSVPATGFTATLAGLRDEVDQLAAKQP